MYYSTTIKAGREIITLIAKNSIVVSQQNYSSGSISLFSWSKDEVIDWPHTVAVTRVTKIKKFKLWFPVDIIITGIRFYKL